MSKDKGTKNIKKAPADKTGKLKVVSDYKSESKSGSSSIVVPQKDSGKSSGKKG